MKPIIYTAIIGKWAKGANPFLWEKGTYCLKCCSSFNFKTYDKEKEPFCCPFCGNTLKKEEDDDTN